MAIRCTIWRICIRVYSNWDVVCSGTKWEWVGGPGGKWQKRGLLLDILRKNFDVRTTESLDKNPYFKGSFRTNQIPTPGFESPNTPPPRKTGLHNRYFLITNTVVVELVCRLVLTLKVRGRTLNPNESEPQDIWHRKSEFREDNMKA